MHVPRSIPRLVVSAAASGSGKTTIAIGLISAFRRRGLRVVAAKAGPDFLDPAHLARASGAPVRNLDPWLASECDVVDAFVRGAHDAQLAIVEGAMGLFDGHHATNEGSSAHLARLLHAPVVVVLDCGRASATLAAVAYGLARYDERTQVAGVILNRVASDRHAATVRDACESAGITVFGAIPRDEALTLPSRHLGLVEPAGDAWDTACDAIARTIADRVDLDALLDAASSAPPLATAAPAPRTTDRAVRVAIARDEAFWFYDETSLDAFADAGMELVPYSPLRDPFPPADAAFIGGGYPELHAAALEANAAARDGLRHAIADGMPVYAECGGLMYLGSTLETANGIHAMTAAIPARSTMSERRSRLRYVEARAQADGPLFACGDVVRGHEFHYSTIRYDDVRPAYAIEQCDEGYLTGSVHASYVHVHLGAYPAAVRRFAAQAAAYARA